MNPDEAQQALARLRELLERRGLGWLVRQVDDAYDAGAAAEGPDDPATQRLMLLADAAIDVLDLTAQLTVATPPLLLEGTDADEVVLLGRRRDHVVDEVPVEAGDPETQANVERLVGRLAALRQMAAEGL